MINQRQGGRRRGRGGQRGQNLGGQPGNRQDNRQRGNAAQLLEKYKSLARDAQLAGDRVQTEYYLQYADHYFRILSENRARFEDQRRQRDESDEDEGEEMVDAADGDGGDEDRQSRGDRGDRYPRRDRDRDRDRERERGPRRFREERGADEANDDDDRGSRVNGRDDDSLPLDVLPPSIGADGPTSFAPDEPELQPEPEPEPEAERAPRRRTRARKATEGDDKVAPAA